LGKGYKFSLSSKVIFAVPTVPYSLSISKHLNQHPAVAVTCYNEQYLCFIFCHIIQTIFKQEMEMTNRAIVTCSKYSNFDDLVAKENIITVAKNFSTDVDKWNEDSELIILARNALTLERKGIKSLDSHKSYTCTEEYKPVAKVKKSPKKQVTTKSKPILLSTDDDEEPPPPKIINSKKKKENIPVESQTSTRPKRTQSQNQRFVIEDSSSDEDFGQPMEQSTQLPRRFGHFL
jgi:hypothetical protein